MVTRDYYLGDLRYGLTPDESTEESTSGKSVKIPLSEENSSSTSGATQLR